MSDETCTKRMSYTCTEQRHEATEVGQCPSFVVPLPFGAQLVSNGYCITYKPPTAPANGTYGKVVVSNGTITGVVKEEVEQYTSSPCAPIPCDCSGGTLDSASTSTMAGNIITTDPTGKLYASLNILSGSGIAISGDGSPASPMTISANIEASSVAMRSGNTAITVEGSGSSNSPFVITHKPAVEGTYSGFQFDNCGHFIGYSQPSGESSAVQGIIAGPGIDVATNGPVATISLSGANGNGEHVPDGVYSVGGYELKVFQNQFAKLERKISINSGTYDLGGFNVAVNNFGSITDISEDAVGVAVSGRSIREGNTAPSSITATITLSRTSGLRLVAYCKGATMPASVTFTIDGTAITTDAMANQAHALSTALYGVGTHTVVFNCAGAQGPVYMDIMMVEIV